MLTRKLELQKQNNMLILGIDPGTATTGYSLIESEGDNIRLLDFGIIKTQATTENAERLSQICADIEELVSTYHPDEAAIEDLFFSKNVKTAMKVAQARGAIIATLSKAKVKIHEYKPVEVKSAVTGNGRAEKMQIQKMTQIILGLKEIPKPDDAADAIAIAICHINSRKFNENGKFQT